jgi:DNA-binding NtrC family response regulator
MEIILRASLGHLELRRMALGRARRELKAALKLARSQKKPAIEAVILNNLGIAERQLDRFQESRRSFLRAERLLRRAGEGRSLIKIACNLALLAAYEGDLDASRLQVERALQLLRHHPGQRLEFFVSYTRGVAAGHFGDAPSALDALEEALPLGRKLGDFHLVHFGEVLLAESHLACGRYLKALRGLKKTWKSAGKEGPPLLRRMVLTRWLLVEGILGHERGQAAAQKLLLEAPRTGAELPEAWNDLYLGLAAVVSGKPASEHFEKALKLFRQIKVPAGERLALAGLLTEALASRQSARVEELTRTLTGVPGSLSHKLLSVLEPLLLAEAHFFRGDAEAAAASISKASGAIVGMPFLELDWRIEFLRGRIALRGGDRSGARRHIQRSFHTRELLAELVPGAARASFLAHPRFQGLTETLSRIERFPKVVPSTDKLWSGPFAGMIGQSSGMVRIFQAIERLRDQEIPVLIRGETGTGKELVARALHQTSSRRNGPFLAVHCAALPEDLFEAEFFGYEAGAFTGAETGHAGILENLAGGTLLLDDVQQLSLKSQAKLLHALSSGRIRRLGGAAQYPIDVRVLASSGIDLSKEVERQTFRGDLFYRLRVLEIVLPPLRDRKLDIPLLARHFLELHAKRMERPVPVMESGAVELLEAQDWPGNVRELESVCLRALLGSSDRERVRREDLSSLLPERKAEEIVPEELLKGRSFKELKLVFERAFVARLFREARGDLRRVMAELGIQRTQLYALVRKLGLDMRKLRGGPGRA